MQRLWNLRSPIRVVVAAVAALAVVCGQSARVWTADTVRAEDPAVTRARDQVRMLDDLYKTAVVTITETYVRAQEQQPAAKIAKKIFRVMNDKGYHHARLVDATGEPLNSANTPRTDWEKKAVPQIKAGKAYVEEIGEKDGQRVYRAATVVPVVMKQCLVCHPGHKGGDVLGAIVYELPIK